MPSTVNDCALVSSSGVLLESSNGKAIDRHRLVLRMGAAPAYIAYALHVGLSTDVRLVQLSHFDPKRNTWRTAHAHECACRTPRGPPNHPTEQRLLRAAAPQATRATHG